MNAISLKNISKTYKGTIKRAVSDFSIEIKEGNIVTLLGPSGCGKTTILRLIAGFEIAEEGEIYVKDKKVSDSSLFIQPEKREIGMVFQDYALFPHLNVYDNVSFGYKNKNKNKRVNEVLELVNLSGLEKRYIHELSGGQQQRVALARALAKKPSVVLLDEPFSNLDASLRASMRNEMKKIIKETNSTAIFVSHDQKDALAISDKIVILKDGIIQQIGTPKEIYSKPQNKFVASFVGRSNIIEGTIGNDGKCIYTNIGVLKNNQNQQMCCGKKVCLSIRPNSIQISEDSSFKGKVKQFSYTGDSLDTLITVESPNGAQKDLHLSTNPNTQINIGDTVCFDIAPDCISYIQ